MEPPSLGIASIAIDDKAYLNDASRLAFGNGDGIIQSGESVEIYVTLVNKGTGPTKDLRILIVGAQGQDLRILERNAIKQDYSMGSIEAGQSKQLVFAAAISKLYESSMKEGELPLKLEITDSRPQFSKELPLNLRLQTVYPRVELVKVESKTTSVPLPGAISTLGEELLKIPVYKTPERKNAYAVIIGIENYAQAVALPRADYAARDAQTVRDYFIQALGIPARNIAFLRNEEASLSGMTKRLETWLANNAESDSEIFVYFSGHGAPDPATKSSYLVPYDGDPAYLESTGYSVNKLYKKLEETKAKKIFVILDACFTGVGTRTVIAKGTRPLIVGLKKEAPGTERLAVLTAAGGDQTSGTYDEKQFGLMTYYFLYGLQGEADDDKNGKIYLREIYDYLKNKVQDIAWKQGNRKQEPQLLWRDPKGWDKEPLVVLR